MKPCKWIKSISLFVACFALYVPKVHALAGFAELHSTFHYNKYADISWGHPSDGCRYRDQYCLHLIEKNQLKKPFNEILHTISLPQDPQNTMVLMETSDGRWIGHEIYGQWIIYDLLSGGIIFSSDNLEEALKKWERLDFQKPKFVNAYNDLSLFFTETEESKAHNDELFYSFYLPLFIAGLFGGMVLMIYLHWDVFLALILLAFLVYLYKRFSYK